MKKCTALRLLAALASLQLSPIPVVAAPEWNTSQGIPRICGGIGLDEFAQLKAKEGEASAELLFTAGRDGVYLAGVDVSVSGQPLTSPLRWTSEGPLCLLKLPRGSYEVEATYDGVRQTHKLQVGRGTSQLQFRYPFVN